MARIRTIKPEFFSSGDIVSMSPLARILFIALWCEADREGRFKWDPKTLKHRYLPGDDVKVEDLGEEMNKNGVVEFYEVGGVKLACIPSFHRHQVINNRERQSELPPIGREGRKGRERKEGRNRVTDASSTRECGKFNQFWIEYPNKKAKQDAQKAFDKLNPDSELFDKMVAALGNQKISQAWLSEGGKYIPLPASWLRGNRWEDEITESHDLEQKRRDEAFEQSFGDSDGE